MFLHRLNWNDAEQRLQFNRHNKIIVSRLIGVGQNEYIVSRGCLFSFLLCMSIALCYLVSVSHRCNEFPYRKKGIFSQMALPFLQYYAYIGRRFSKRTLTRSNLYRKHHQFDPICYEHSTTWCRWGKRIANENLLTSTYSRKRTEQLNRACRMRLNEMCRTWNVTSKKQKM